MLTLKNVNQFYGGSHTLWDLDLWVPKGSCTCLMGRNGMGKTTLLKCIMGLLPLASGELSFDGRDLRSVPAEARARLGIGYVPQGREIFSQLTVEENLRVGLAARKDGARTIPGQIYELFPVLQRMLNRRGGDLSGGQQQQLAIGRALIGNPSLMILDESSEGVQPSIVQHICDALKSFRNELGTTIVFVEQNLDTILAIAERCYIMEKGKITRSLTGENVNADNVRAQLLL